MKPIPGITRLNINISEQQKDKLDKLSAKTGAPVAELVRRAIELYFKKET
jgi:predicted DNA-binding protein